MSELPLLALIIDPPDTNADLMTVREVMYSDLPSFGQLEALGKALERHPRGAEVWTYAEGLSLLTRADFLAVHLILALDGLPSDDLAQTVTALRPILRDLDLSLAGAPLVGQLRADVSLVGGWCLRVKMERIDDRDGRRILGPILEWTILPPNPTTRARGDSPAWPLRLRYLHVAQAAVYRCCEAALEAKTKRRATSAVKNQRALETLRRLSGLPL